MQEKNKPENLATFRRSKKSKNVWNGIPAFIKKRGRQNSLKDYFLISTVNHIIFFLILFGVFSVFKTKIVDPMLHKKVNDIEFTINNSAGYTPHLGGSAPASKPETTAENSAEKKSQTGSLFPQIEIPDDFSIPMPKFKPLSSGSGGLGKRTSDNSSAASRGLNPSDIGSNDGSPDAAGASKGGGFDKNAVRKTLAVYDISPYVNELKRNIRMNWRQPKNSNGKSVELFLRIAKDGRLIILNVKKTSETGEVDEAALNAVRKSLPLSPLPSKYGKSFLDIIFTFDAGGSFVGSRY